ncbi:MAG: ABC transporter permease [Anaeroplasmataceae bacterium]
MKKTILNITYPLIVVLSIILIWFISSLIVDVELILPSPIKAIKELFNYLGSLSLYKALLMSILRMLCAFVLSYAIAFILALLSYKYEIGRKIISPLISIIRGIPTMAIILILIIWMNPSTTPIVVTFIVLMPVIYSNIIASLSMISTDILEMAKIYNVSKKNIITKIYIPTIKLPLTIGAAGSLNLGLKLVIAAEALSGARYSIGKMMQYEKIWLETSRLFALAILCIIVGSIMEAMVKYIGRRLSV